MTLFLGTSALVKRYLAEPGSRSTQERVAPPEIREGSAVAVLAAADGEPVALSSNEEQELSDAMAQIDSGQYVDGWRLLEELRVKSRV